MENLIIQLSKYIIIILFAIYTLYCFTVFRGRDKERQKRIYRKQQVLMYLIHLICHLLLFLNTQDTQLLIYYGLEVVFFATSAFVYRFVYRNLSRLVFNNMQMLLAISFIMLARLEPALAKRQLFMAAAGLLICLVVPFLIEKFRYIDRLGWLYAVLGLICLLSVFIPGVGIEKYGASNWIKLGPVTLQPSEFVKIIFVFFIAALLAKSTEFKEVAKITVLAAAYVLVLVLERDLGGAFIFFVTYMCVLYAATSQPMYTVAGVGAFSIVSVVAYQLFSHVRVRVQAFLDPWSDIDTGGYQVASSLFAIGTGGWFGMGLGKGLPMSIPVRESDFIFSAISEEMGGIFAVCMILVCLSCFIMFVNIAMKMRRTFYKLTALGLSVIYIFQVFLTIGGAIKFIPSTGVTLPLVSYGGSSVLSTVLLFSIIQGMYVLNQDEVRRNEER
ncbi:FtsW/RodA/SpoVE family cell cycle protein [Acetivibrio ethanolgignens]|uniref:Cell division protein FtsW n=1 Tax=Acetivibrio ethanolgignens TaxID=290052 RepID=A0A0V8QGG4_9FIRM|nr:FtsW/RodA/SpoVE family cell cycle protein [Acetivibrio ethanolgignens]KSV59518.1 cell division protein FtsW [Acetivibrio ethanolgignens]